MSIDLLWECVLVHMYALHAYHIAGEKFCQSLKLSLKGNSPEFLQLK